MEPIPKDVLRAWNRWFAVIQNVSCRRMVRKHLKPAEYRQLHAELMLMCRLCADHPDAEVVRRVQEMADFADPWINLDILCETNLSLIREVAHEGETRFGRRWNLSLQRFGGFGGCLKLALYAGLIGGVILYWRQPEIFMPLAVMWRNWWRIALRFVDNNRTEFCLLTVLFAAVMAVVLNFTRRY